MIKYETRDSNIIEPEKVNSWKQRITYLYYLLKNNSKDHVTMETTEFKQELRFTLDGKRYKFTIERPDYFNIYGLNATVNNKQIIIKDIFTAIRKKAAGGFSRPFLLPLLSVVLSLVICCYLLFDPRVLSACLALLLI